MTIQLNKKASAFVVLFAVTLAAALFVPSLRAQTSNQGARAGGAAKAAKKKPGPPASTKQISVRGRVVDQTGRPVAGADVWLPIQRFEMKRVAQAQTDDKGQFTLAVPNTWFSPLRWRNLSLVWAFKRGRSLGSGSAYKTLFAGNEEERIEIRLGPATKTSFLVFDPKGKPLRGAIVQPVHLHVSGNYDFVPDEVLQRVRASTDQDGRARLPAVPHDGMADVNVTSRLYGTQRLRLDRRAAAQERTVWLRPVGRLEGRLVADRREWVRGVRMQVRSVAFEDGYQSTFAVADLTTDAQGRFVVPALAEGRVEIDEVLDQKLPVRVKLPNRGEVEMIAAETKRLEIPLVPGVRVRGQIRVRGTGKPVAGARISIRYGVIRQGDDVVSDKNGRFEGRVLPGKHVYQRAFALPAGLIQLGTQDPPRGDGTIPPPRAPWEDRFEVPPDVAVFDMPVIEVARRIRVSGRLLDENDRPIAGATLWGVAGNRRYGSTRTDDEGRFTLRLPPGVEMESYRLSLGRASYTATVEKKQPLVLRAKVGRKAP